MSKPTLTIAVPCPTCGGITPEPGNALVIDGGLYDRCPDCTDGTIRTPVSCAGCKHYSSMLDYPGGPNDYGRCFFVTAGDERLDVLPEWGCLSWEAKA